MIDFMEALAAVFATLIIGVGFLAGVIGPVTLAAALDNPWWCLLYLLSPFEIAAALVAGPKVFEWVAG